jgi:hypothetical protein
MGKKSQAAMEFLMTYGWAILVVLVAIGALAYFGVLSPDKFLPSRCSLPAGISCIDHKAVASDSEVRVVLKSGLGFDTTGVTAAVSGCTTSLSTTLDNGEQKTLTATTCGLTSGSKFSGELNLTYTNSDSGLSHTVQGSIITRVE